MVAQVEAMTHHHSPDPVCDTPRHTAQANRAGHARIACEVSSIALPAAGTHRSDSGAAQCRA
ncbi:MAG TPA: hypothetical protein IGP91_12565 [Thermosynechococcus sp. M46_R2017_013]|nr:hypothetical protein [Thermosynechococcus sp. M46_R2017_013]